MKPREAFNSGSLHREFELASGFPDAVVFVHGILGSPAQFQFLAEELHRAGYDCMALLLPGHGGTAKAFSGSAGRQWQNYADEYIEQVRQRYRRVFLIGHSLGGLLSLNYASHHEISGIVLLNTPLFFKLSFNQIFFSIRILFSDPARDDAFLSAYRLAFSISPAKIYDYPLWIRQFASLYCIARKARGVLTAVKAPVLVIQSGRDESVGKRSAMRLKFGLANASTEIVELNESYHVYFSEGDQQRLLMDIEQFIQSVQK